MRRAYIEVADGGGSRRISYLEAGDAENPRVVLCVPGMTRNARDFEPLAEALAKNARVIAVDVAGRGESDYLADPGAYGIPTYIGDILALLDRLGAPSVDWIGTSMGGLIGIEVAGAPDASVRGVVSRLVLNDIGPFIPKAALQRIADYVASRRPFADLTAAEASYRENYAPFALRSDAEWRWFTEISVRPDGAGGYLPNHDPAIGDAYRGAVMQDAERWRVWDRIACPVLILRGAVSDILLRETAEEMTRRGPGATLVTFAGIGHAPALLAPDQIAAVTEWLASAD